MSVIETTCAKTILTGEHAVVYGAPSIAIPIPDLQLNFEYSQNFTGRFEVSLDGKSASAKILTIIDQAYDLLDIRDHGMKLICKSNIPVGAGFGSSAALCVGLIKTIAKGHNLFLDVDKIMSLANQLEKSFHGNPSGLDTAVVLP